MPRAIGRIGLLMPHRGTPGFSLEDPAPTSREPKRMSQCLTPWRIIGSIRQCDRASVFRCASSLSAWNASSPSPARAATRLHNGAVFQPLRKVGGGSGPSTASIAMPRRNNWSSPPGNPSISKPTGKPSCVSPAGMLSPGARNAGASFPAVADARAMATSVQNCSSHVK